MVNYDDTKYKDPDAVLPYRRDWADWLAEVGDTIATSAWSVTPAGLTLGADFHTDTDATIWLSGGTDGVRYFLRNRITTAGGATDDKTFALIIGEE